MRGLAPTLVRTSRAIRTSSAISKSNIPASEKSAPFSKTYRNASAGGMAPAAMTLNAIHGFSTLFMKSTVSWEFEHQDES